MNVDLGLKLPVDLRVLFARILYCTSVVPDNPVCVYERVFTSVVAILAQLDSGSVTFLYQTSYPIIIESPSSIGGVQLKLTEVEVEETRAGAPGAPGASAQ